MRSTLSAVLILFFFAISSLSVQAQNDPQKYLKLVNDAEAAATAKDWKKAAGLWTAVNAQNPFHRGHWQKLADSRRLAGDYQGAIGAYGKVIELTTSRPADAAYDIARCHAALGEMDRAMEWLEKAMSYGYRYLNDLREEPLFESYKADARFRELATIVDTSKMDRVPGWRYDLALLSREVKRRAVPQFHAERVKDFDAAVTKLNADIPKLTDWQITLEMMKVMRTVGDGHSMIFAFFERPEFLKLLPIDFYFFKEGLYITAAHTSRTDLLGAKILRFDDNTVDTVRNTLDPLHNLDNEMTPIVLAQMRMRNLPLLHAAGLIKEAEKVTLTVQDTKGVTRTVVLGADSGVPSRMMWDVMPPDWKSYHETLTAPVPLYLKNRFANYWFEYLGDSKTVYFQFNRVRDADDEPFDKFCERLFKFIEEKDVKRLVIDMRNNNGGNSYLEPPLIHGLIRSTKLRDKGGLFVVIGRKTFSAAQNGATWIEQNTNAIFVGEPTGSSPNFVGEESPFELPYSKLMANVSDLYWQSSWPNDKRTWIAPTIYTPPSFEYFKANRDPAMEAINTF